MSGAGSKAIRVYDARTGDEIRSYPVPEAGFINDVIVTRRGAYFTDSAAQQLYFIPFGKKGALGELQRIPITGDFVYGAGFNANGIEAAQGRQDADPGQEQHPGKLLHGRRGDRRRRRRSRSAATGHQRRRAAAQGPQALRRRATATTSCASCELVASDLSSARHGARRSRGAEFDVPTTIARSGGRNYVVNAQVRLRVDPRRTPTRW